MTRRQLLTLLLATFLGFVAFAGSPAYVGSRKAAPFHRLACSFAARISHESAVYFETREAAITAGHRPCEFCVPQLLRNSTVPITDYRESQGRSAPLC